MAFDVLLYMMKCRWHHLLYLLVLLYLAIIRIATSFIRQIPHLLCYKMTYFNRGEPRSFLLHPPQKQQHLLKRSFHLLFGRHLTDVILLLRHLHHHRLLYYLYHLSFKKTTTVHLSCSFSLSLFISLSYLFFYFLYNIYTYLLPFLYSKN